MMEEPMKLEMTLEETAQVSALIDQCLKAIREANEQMDQTEAGTAQLQAETRAMLNQLRLTLNAETTL